MSGSFIPLLAKVKFGTQVVMEGHTTGASLHFGLDVEEHYGFGDAGKPTLVKSNRHFSGSLDKIYTTKTYAEMAMAGTPMDIVFYPEGDATGKQTITVKNAILSEWNLSMPREEIVAEDVAFLGDDLVFGTAP